MLRSSKLFGQTLSVSVDRSTLVLEQERENSIAMLDGQALRDQGRHDQVLDCVSVRGRSDHVGDHHAARKQVARKSQQPRQVAKCCVELPALELATNFQSRMRATCPTTRTWGI